MRRRDFIGLGAAFFWNPLFADKKEIEIIPYEMVKHESLERVRRALEETYKRSVFIGERLALPANAYFAPRNRYYGLRLIEQLEELQKPWHTLGVTDADMYEPNEESEHWGVIGVARPEGLAAVVSTHRTKRDWLEKAAVHELGHNYLGMQHCGNKECQLLDIKGKGANYDTVTLGYFCPEHKQALRTTP